MLNASTYIAPGKFGENNKHSPIYTLYLLIQLRHVVSRLMGFLLKNVRGLRKLGLVLESKAVQKLSIYKFFTKNSLQN